MKVGRVGSRFVVPRRPFDCGYWAAPPENRRRYRVIDVGQWKETEVLAGSLGGPIVGIPENLHVPGTAVVGRGGDATTQSLLDASKAIESDFKELADEWDRETILESLPSRMAMHAAYQRIIGLGPAAVPLILRRLLEEPNYWFWALTSITGQDPAEGEATLHGATEKWLTWGRKHGLLE